MWKARRREKQCDITSNETGKLAEMKKFLLRGYFLGCSVCNGKGVVNKMRIIAGRWEKMLRVNTGSLSYYIIIMSFKIWLSFIAKL